MLDALVLSNGAVEHAPLAPIGAGTRQCIAPETDRFNADENAFRIETVEKIAKALSFLTDAVLIADEEIVDEHRVRIDRAAAHFLDAPDFNFRAVEIGVEERHPFRRFFAFASRCRAREKEKLVRLE